MQIPISKEPQNSILLPPHRAGQASNCIHRITRSGCVISKPLALAASLLAFSPMCHAGLVANESATWPDEPAIQTFVRNDANVEAERDVRFTRNLAQTFQVAAPIKLDKIYIDYEEGIPGKEITIRLFSVADVNAASLVQPGGAGFTGTEYLNLVYTTGELIDPNDGGNNPMGVIEFDLTGEHEVTLPASTGTAGYALQFVRSGDGSTADDSNERAFKWHFNDGNNLYPGGRTYAITGGGVDATDDFLMAILEYDTSPPTIVDARSSATLNTLTVVFSETVDPVTAAALANYSVSPSLTLSNPEMLNSRTVRFSTTAQTAGDKYTLTVNNVRDDAATPNTIAANTQVDFNGWIKSTGFLTAEFFHNIDPRSVYVIDLLNWPAFSENKPDNIISLPTLSTPNGYGEDYGARVSGVLIPKESGSYHFFVRSDDGSQFFINTTGEQIPDPLTSLPVAEESDCCDPFQEPGALNDDQISSATTSTPISLTAGERYGVLFLLKEGGGGDYGMVAMRKEGDTTPAAELTPISGELFEAWVDPTGAALEITTPPANLTIQEGLDAVFSVETTASTPYVGYQWYKNGVEIPGATGPSLTLPAVQNSDNNVQITVRTRVPGLDETSPAAILTVTDDTTAPTLVSASGKSHVSTMWVTFSEPVTQATATALANYSLSPSVTLSDPVMVDETTIRFTTSALTAGTEYTVTVNGVRDLGNNTIAADSQVKFTPYGTLLQTDLGFVVWEAEDYDSITGSLWTTDSTSGIPSGGVSMTMPDNVSDGEFTDELVYQITFTQTGTHKIWYRARANDGNADSVWLHYDGARPPERDPANGAAANSASMAGFNVGAGADFVWRSDSQDGPDPMTFEVATAGLHTISIGSREDGAYLDKFIITTDMAFTPTGFGPNRTVRQGEPEPPGAEITITQQPVSQTVLETRPVTFTVAATSPDPLISYQWQRKEGASFVDIEGATGTRYTIASTALAQNATVYRAKIAVPGTIIFSDEVTLTVQADTIAPTIVGAGAFSGATTVGVAFNEAVDPASITAGQFVVSGANVTAANLHGGRIVELTLDVPAGANFTVTVNGVKDVLGNTLASTTVNGQISDMTAQDLGTSGVDPVEPGTAFTWGTGFFIAGGGTDIWDSDDAGYIVYKEFTGAFDMRARVDSLINGDEWGKATLMARESIQPGARNQAVLITKNGPYPTPEEPSPGPYLHGGVNVYNQQWRDVADAASGSAAGDLRISPTVFPSWLRLVRESATSNEIKSFISYDGETWIPLTSHVTPDPLLPETLVLGMAVTAHDNAAGFAKAEAIYENFSIQPFEPVTDPNLTVSRSGNQIEITWDTGTLVSSTTVDGTYQPVANATSPYQVSPTEAAMFFQVLLP